MDIIARKKINILIQVAQVDHELLQSEVDLIHEIGEKNNLSKGEIEELFENPEPIGSLGALSNRQKFDYLYDCIQVIKADDVIKKSEILFAQSIAINLGFHIRFVGEMIEKVNTKINEEKNRKKVYAWFIENVY